MPRLFLQRAEAHARQLPEQDSLEDINLAASDLLSICFLDVQQPSDFYQRSLLPSLVFKHNYNWSHFQDDDAAHHSSAYSVRYQLHIIFLIKVFTQFFGQGSIIKSGKLQFLRSSHTEAAKTHSLPSLRHF